MVVSTSPIQEQSPINSENAFHSICCAFDKAAEVTNDRNWSLPDGEIDLESLLSAIAEFLSIFDALGSQVITRIVSLDFRSKIDAVRTAAIRLQAQSVVDLAQKETNSPPGFFQSSGIDGLQWAKRVLQFVDGLVRRILENETTEMKDAALASYRENLGYRHNYATRQIFEGALHLLPSKSQFIANLSKCRGPSVSEINSIKCGMREFRAAVRPHIDALTAVFGDQSIIPL